MKKNSLPAIIIWAVYALLSGCLLFLVTLSICGEAGLGPVIGLMFGAVVLAVLAAALFGLDHRIQKRNAAGNVRRRRHTQADYVVSLVTEGAIAIGMMVFMVLVRAGYQPEAYPWYVPASTEYGMAQVGATIPEIAHKGRELYVWLLRAFCFLLGNQTQTVVILQLILLVVAAVCLYFGIRRNAGEIAAMVVLGFLGFTPYMVQTTCRAGAFLLVLACYGIGLAFVSGLPDLKDSGLIMKVIYCVMTGLVIGFCCYLDMAGITLLIFLTGELCFEREGDSANEKPLLLFVICLVSAILGFILYHSARSGAGSPAGASIRAQLGLYVPQRFSLSAGNLPFASWDMALLAVLLAGGIFSFWVDHRIRTRGIWMFAAILLLVIRLFGMGRAEYFDAATLLYLMFAAMGGIGLEYLRLWLHRAHSLAGGEKAMGGADFEMKQIEKTEELEVEIMDQNENGTETKPEFQFIENPLPVPKKRERKTMDYDYEVAEDDDFDIP